MIVVFGSINCDLVTEVARHPVGGQTVLGSDYVTLPGGKGANQALACAKAGAHVVMVGAIGSDEFGNIALSNLHAESVDLTHVKKTTGTSGIALIAIDQSGENTIIVTPGANANVLASDIPQTAYSVLVTQNEISSAEVWKAHGLAKNNGALVVHNAAPAAPVPEAALSNIDYLVANEIEAVLIANTLGFDGAEALAAARFVQSISRRSVVVTLGARGAFAIDGSEEYEIPAPKIDVKDTTGAGDAFVGAFSAALDQQMNMTEALHRGVVEGSMTCQSWGAQSSRA